MEKYFRVFKFSFEVFGMAGKNKNLLKPILFNLAIAAPMNLALALGYSVMARKSGGLAYILLAAGITALYFTDYFCNSLTASLIYDEVKTGNAQVGTAIERVKRSLGGILIFASISAIFDLLASYASERNDIVGKILTQIVYAVWTTATYVIMPAMIIEGVGFSDAFSRSKALMKEDPTQVGSGVVGMALVNWVLGAVCMGAGYFALNALSRIHPMIGAMAFFTMVNVYWAISGFLKITYFTCFYMWASECAARKSARPEWAPAPLAAALQ